VNKRSLVTTLAVTLLVVLVAGVFLGLGNRPNLGLDLQGGISAIYTPQLPEGEEAPEDLEEVIDQTIEVIRARVDSLGVAEPDISRTGTDVLVQLPGIADADRLREIIGTTAQLTFRPVLEVISPGSPGYEEGPDCLAPVDEREELADDAEGILCGPLDELVSDDDATEGLEPVKYRVGPAALTGDRIDDAFPSIGDGQGYSVGLALDRQGAQEFAEITGELACARDQGEAGLLAIVLDQIVESAPAMNPGVACGVGITGGDAQITVGAGSLQDQEQEARDLALILRTGALPISLEPATFETVSATLGTESLRAGLLAGAIGLGLVAIWLLFFYRWLGAVALSALLVFGIVTMAIITAMGAVGFALTLAGVAGLIVAIGITADSSIIFFERIRDEANLGKTVRTSVKTAFASAFRTNLAGNTVTLAAAVILYFLAVGPVRGFALMLGLASILDILIMYFYTRPLVTLMSGTKLLSRQNIRAAEPVTAGAGPRGRRTEGARR
jgi:protein-export membrane protein SecD